MQEVISFALPRRRGTVGFSFRILVALLTNKHIHTTLNYPDVRPNSVLADFNLLFAMKYKHTYHFKNYPYLVKMLLTIKMPQN